VTVGQVHFRWLIALAVACGAIIVFFPFFWMAVTSLKTAPEIQRVPLQIAPDRWLNFSNYLEVFKREPFLRYLLNSSIVASVAAVSSVVVSSLAGFGFAKYRFPGRDVLFLAVVGIMMIPFQSVVVPLYVWMNELGLLDTYAGIVAPDLVSVFGVFLMRQAIEVIPNDYIDAARIDGCQRASNLLLGDPAVVKARHCHVAHHQVHVELERVLLADGGDQQSTDEGGDDGPHELHKHVLHRSTTCSRPPR
jgi:ABC-type glycerol-3-phosphate transport system permease component